MSLLAAVRASIKATRVLSGARVSLLACGLLAEPALAGAIALILVCVAIALLIQARRAIRTLLRIRDRMLP